MSHLVARLSVLLFVVGLSRSVTAQQPSSDAPAQPAAEKEARSPWLLVPLFSSSPKLGTSFGGLGAYMLSTGVLRDRGVRAGNQLIPGPRRFGDSATGKSSLPRRASA